MVCLVNIFQTVYPGVTKMLGQTWRLVINDYQDIR